jgi:hypothetical protein
MSRFYGSVHGSSSTPATRLGRTSIATYCASQSGAIRCEAYIGENNEDWVRVLMIPWQGAGVMHPIYEGPIGRYIDPRGEQIPIGVEDPATPVEA